MAERRVENSLIFMRFSLNGLKITFSSYARRVFSVFFLFHTSEKVNSLTRFQARFVKRIEFHLSLIFHSRSSIIKLWCLTFENTSTKKGFILCVFGWKKDIVGALQQSTSVIEWGVGKKTFFLLLNKIIKKRDRNFDH